VIYSRLLMYGPAPLAMTQLCASSF